MTCTKPHPPPRVHGEGAALPGRRRGVGIAALLLVVATLTRGANPGDTAVALSVPVFRVAEWEYRAAARYDNPFREVDLTATVTHLETGRTSVIDAYWAGGSTWRFRFSGAATGTYAFVTRAVPADPALDGQAGRIELTAAERGNPLYARGPLRRSPRGNYLEHADGTPFFWLADSWWHGMTERLDFPEGFTRLAEDRRAKGFNVIQFAVGFPCDIPPFDPRGRNAAGDPWDREFESIRPAYFDLVDERIEALLERGLVPNLVGMWGYYIKFMGVDNAILHWDYLLARYGAFPIVYTLSGETTLAYYPDLEGEWDRYRHQFREQWSEVAAHIQAHDPYDRLLTTHPGPGLWDGKPPIYAMEHLDFVMLQSGHKGFPTVGASTAYIRDYRARFPDKPVLHGEVSFEGMAGSSWQDVQRLLFWSNVLLGTPGYSYGAEGIWQFNTDDEPFGASPTGHTWGNVPWSVAMDYEGSAQLGTSAEWLRGLRWWELEPAEHRVNWHATPETVYDPYAAEMGEDVLVYFTKAGIGFARNKLRVLGLTPGARYRYVFFDPILGREYPGVTFDAGADGTWGVPLGPIMQDWVVWVSPAPPTPGPPDAGG